MGCLNFFCDSVGRAAFAAADAGGAFENVLRFSGASKIVFTDQWVLQKLWHSSVGSPTSYKLQVTLKLPKLQATNVSYM